MKLHNRKIKFPVQNRILEFEIDGQNITIDIHRSLKVSKGMLNKILHFAIAVHSHSNGDKYLYINKFTQEIRQIEPDINYVEMMEMEATNEQTT